MVKKSDYFLATIRVLLLGSTLLWLGCGDDKPAESDQLTDHSALFRKVPASQSGINHQSHTHARDLTGLLSGGGGVAAGDINNDGQVDLLFSGGYNNCKLYLNKGNLSFEEISASAGVIDTGLNVAHTEGVNLVDVNGDGWLDIYLLKSGLRQGERYNTFTDYGANLLYINEGAEAGGLKFREAAAEYGLDIIGLSTAAQFFDYDNDGDLDVYIAQTPDVGSAFNMAYYDGKPANVWFNDQLLENVNGRFFDVRQRAGILYERNLSLSVSVADINNDGWLDLYVANDFFGRDFLYVNTGRKGFKESHAEYFTQSAMSAMGSDFADFNGDGYEDLFVGEMMPEKHKRQKLNVVPFSIEIYDRLQSRNQAQYTRNMLQLNQGGEQFRDVGLMAGVYATEWSWSSFFFDADQDGLLDLFVPNGIKRDMTNMDFIKRNYGDTYTDMANPAKQQGVNPGQLPSVTTPNYIFRNEGDLTFAKAPENWGINDKVHTRGATYADLDNDGDLEIILNNLDATPIIYENLVRQQQQTHYLKIRLKGAAANTYGIGARVIVWVDGQSQQARMLNQRGFQSGPEPLLFFGLGTHTQVDSLIVEWPGQKQSRMQQVPVDQLITVLESSARPAAPYRPATPKTLFERQNDRGKAIVHYEAPYNDFKYQRLLTRKYSTEGPALAAGDVNGDGFTDYIIAGNQLTPHWLLRGTANGYDPRLFRATPDYQEEGEVQTISLFDANGDGFPDLYLGRGSNEFPAGDARLRDLLLLNDGKGKFSLAANALPDLRQSTHCIAPFDLDGDGDLDLFVGANIVPGNYGQIPESYLLRNDGGTFTEVTDSWAPGLKTFGRINTAIWTDFDNDNDQDLMLAGEWFPLSFFRNEQGTLKQVAFSTLTHSGGWYQCLLAADFDKDGDQDYIAGNFGLNTILKASREAPLTLLTDDFDKNGTLDPVLFHYTAGTNAPFVNRDLFVSQMPQYNNRFFTFERYADATWENLFTPTQKDAASLSHVHEMRSMYIENLGRGEFRMSPLPNAAQMGPVMDIACDDFNHDGHLDLIVGGQFRGNHYEYGPMDASEGQLLYGNGKGAFTAVPASQSGLLFKNELRELLWVPKASPPQLLVANSNGPLEVWQLRP